MGYSVAELEQSSERWMDCLREAVSEVNVARSTVELTKAKNDTAKAELKAARFANREAQMPVYCADDQNQLKQLKALLALRNAELRAIRTKAKAEAAAARHEAAWQRMKRVEKGEGFELPA